MDYDYLDLLKFRFNYLRKYTPTLLEALEFTSTKSGEPLLQAIETIKEMNKIINEKFQKELLWTLSRIAGKSTFMMMMVI